MTTPLTHPATPPVTPPVTQSALPAALSARLRSASTLVRWLVVVALAIAFFRHENLARPTLALIRDANPASLLLALLLYTAGLFVAGYRVRLLVDAIGHDVAYRTLVADGMRAIGLSATLAMGAGDVYRVARLGAEGLDLARASGVVLIDRGMGILAIGMTALLGLSFLGGELLGFSLPLVASLSVALGALTLVVFGSRRAAERWLPSALAFFVDPRRTAAMVACSALCLGLWIGSVVACASALGIEVSTGALAAAASLVTVATLMPISIGGVGLREAGYVLLLAPFGVSTSQAVALGLTQYAAMILLAAIAWLLFPIGRLATSRTREGVRAA